MSRRFWDEEIETMEAASLARIEDDRLRSQVEYVYSTSPFYRQRLDESSVRPEQVRSINDLARIPLTEKADLAERQRGVVVGPNQSADSRDIILIVATGGTTRSPFRLAWTRQDVDDYVEVGARALWAMGCRPIDTVFNCFNYSLYAGGVLDHGMFERLGATTIPHSVGNSIRLIDLINSLDTDVAIYSTPSYAVRLATVARENDIEPADVGISKGFFSGEAGLQLPGYRSRVESTWGMVARDLWGLAEVGGQSAECEYADRLHYMAQGVVAVELIDSSSEEVIELTDGAIGELVMTPLRRQASPVLRLRSHDLVQTTVDPCPCGRTGFRFRTLGRSDDMFVVGGVNVFPLGIQEVLDDMTPLVSGEFVVELDHEPPIDYRPRLKVETDGRNDDHVTEQVTETIRRRLGFTPEVVPVESGTIASEHKTRRVVKLYEEAAG